MAAASHTPGTANAVAREPQIRERIACVEENINPMIASRVQTPQSIFGKRNTVAGRGGKYCDGES